MGGVEASFSNYLLLQWHDLILVLGISSGSSGKNDLESSESDLSLLPQEQKKDHSMVPLSMVLSPGA